MPAVPARPIRRAILAIVGALALVLGAPLAAHANELGAESTALQERVEAILDQYPGGTQIAENEIAWDGGAVILTLEASGGITPMAVGSCATGSYCAYSGYNLTGSKLSFSSCGAPQPVGVLGTVRSIANARTAGAIEAQSSGGGWLATIGANGALFTAPSGVAYLNCL